MKGLQVYGLLIFNVSFSIYSTRIMIRNRKHLKNPVNLWIHIAVEFLLAWIFFIMILFFYDPHGFKWSSATRELWELVAIICVVLIALIMTIKLLVGLQKQLISKSKKQALRSA
jgi:hypothetical protein